MKRNEKGEMIVFQTESSSRKTLDKGFYTHKHNSAGFKSQHIVDIHGYTIHVVSGIECSKSDKALYDFNYQASLTTNGNVILGDTGYRGCRDVLTTLPKKPNQMKQMRVLFESVIIEVVSYKSIIVCSGFADFQVFGTECQGEVFYLTITVVIFKEMDMEY